MTASDSAAGLDSIRSGERLTEVIALEHGKIVLIQSAICPSQEGHFRAPIIDFFRQCLQKDLPHFSHA